MTYSAGALDQRVTFRRETKASDGMGGSTTTWSDVATVWALVRPMTGREREHSDRLNASADYLIVIRSGISITEQDIAVWNGVQFNIRFAKLRGRSAYLELEAERGAAI